VNPTVFRACVLQRLSSPARIGFAALPFLFPLAAAWFLRDLAALGQGTAPAFAWVFGAGVLGQEVSSGVLQLAFARPVRRWQYAVSRWLAVASVAFGVAMVQLALGVLIVALRGGAPAPAAVGALALDAATTCLGVTAVLLLFSSMAGGVGDLGLLMVVTVAGTIGQQVGMAAQRPWAARIGEEIVRFTGASVHLGPLLHGRAPSWFELASWLSTVTLSVAVACVLLDRRELSYATD
jgi:hypothetical protein